MFGRLVPNLLKFRDTSAVLHIVYNFRRISSLAFMNILNM